MQRKLQSYAKFCLPYCIRVCDYHTPAYAYAVCHTVCLRSLIKTSRFKEISIHIIILFLSQVETNRNKDTIIANYIAKKLGRLWKSSASFSGKPSTCMRLIHTIICICKLAISTKIIHFLIFLFMLLKLCSGK